MLERELERELVLPVVLMLVWVRLRDYERPRQTDQFRRYSTRVVVLEKL
jgi:hypothetical protein